MMVSFPCSSGHRSVETPAAGFGSRHRVLERPDAIPAASLATATARKCLAVEVLLLCRYAKIDDGHKTNTHYRHAKRPLEFKKSSPHSEGTFWRLSNSSSDFKRFEELRAKASSAWNSFHTSENRSLLCSERCVVWSYSSRSTLLDGGGQWAILGGKRCEQT